MPSCTIQSSYRKPHGPIFWIALTPRKLIFDTRSKNTSESNLLCNQQVVFPCLQASLFYMFLLPCTEGNETWIHFYMSMDGYVLCIIWVLWIAVLFIVSHFIMLTVNNYATYRIRIWYTTEPSRGEEKRVCARHFRKFHIWKRSHTFSHFSWLMRLQRGARAYLTSSKGEDGAAKIELYTFPLSFPKNVQHCELVQTNFPMWEINRASSR